MPLTYVLILFVTPFSIFLAGLNPLISESTRLLIWDLWLDKGIALNIGLSLGLIMGAELQTKYTAYLKTEMKDAIRAGLNKIQK